jgi:hypothetical protein
MNSHNNIQDELNGLNSSLPPVTGHQPFSVPEGYFDNLAASVLAKIKGTENASAAEEIASISPLLAGISRAMPYAVPDNYFEKELEELPFLIAEDPKSSILSLIDKVTPYEVPANYFTYLPEQLLRKVTAPKAKVVSMAGRKWMRWAVAAMVAGIISLSGYFYFNQKNSGSDSGRPIAQQLKNVSTKELDEFIKTTDITLTSTETAKAKASGKTEVQKLLTDVSDKELDVFLSQVPTDDEDLLVIN